MFEDLLFFCQYIAVYNSVVIKVLWADISRLQEFKLELRFYRRYLSNYIMTACRGVRDPYFCTRFYSLRVILINLRHQERLFHGKLVNLLPINSLEDN